MELGVCYYPEHWSKDTWRRDAERMVDLGLSWVRIGEFAWGRLEPHPNQLDFSWLDESMDILGEAGLKVILGTPTATPPKWLCDRDPAIYQVDKEGRIRGFGSRRHYSYNSPDYQRETERIVALLAAHYAHHPALGAWQTDNEYGCHGTIRSYGKHDRVAFQRWCEAKYGHIDKLNEAWWNRFWSMDYQGFSEIELPNLTVTEPNPSHSLDFYRFSSDAAINYNRLQCEIIRRYSDKPISHNVMLFFEDFDHFKLAKDLDIITWDSYPLGMLEQSPLPDPLKTQFMRSGHPDLVSFMHDLYYGLKSKPFWVMEQQPGQVNWAPSNPLPAKGMVRLWTHQAFAHGAEVVSYFRWRAATGAQELMHAGLNKHNGQPDRASLEVKQLKHELKIMPKLSKNPAQVALLFDYENMWATDLQPHAQGWRYWKLAFDYYHSLRKLAVDVDIRHPYDDLDPYALVFAPALHLIDETLAKHLKTYCEAGGHLIIGPRSGMKTLSNTVLDNGITSPTLSAWQNLTGIRVDLVDGLRPNVHEKLSWQAQNYHYHTWADIFELLDAKALAHYRCFSYEGVAIAEKTHARGEVISLGCWGDEGFHQAFFSHCLAAKNIEHQALDEALRQTTLDNRHYWLNFSAKTMPSPLGNIPPYDLRLDIETFYELED
ncbi:MAG: beta-galactosidase [Deinococcales bacterium]